MSSNKKMGEDDVTQQPIGALNLSLALWILATCLNGQMRKQISALLLLFGMMLLTCMYNLFNCKAFIFALHACITIQKKGLGTLKGGL